MARPRSLVLAAALAGAGVATSVWPGVAAQGQAPAPAKDAWKREFEDVCSKTQDAMTLSSDELRSLIERCDKLKPLVEGLADSQRRVFSKRLRDCRAVYQFVLDSREKG